LNDAASGADIVQQEVAAGELLMSLRADGASSTMERPAIVLAPSLIVIVGFTKLPLASRCPARISVI
jgi:hypothetical protein